MGFNLATPDEGGVELADDGILAALEDHVVRVFKG